MTVPAGPDGEELAARLARALDLLDRGEPVPGPELRDLTRALVRSFAAAHPGRSVELRVPPYVAVQCVAGPRHTRGTPPNVVETDPLTWLQLCAGRVTWAAAAREGLLFARGERADFARLLPHQA